MTYTDHMPDNMSFISTQCARASGDLAKTKIFQIICLLQTNLCASGVPLRRRDCQLAVGAQQSLVCFFLFHFFYMEISEIMAHLHRVGIKDI